MRIKNQQNFLDKEQGKKGIEKGMKNWKKLIIIGIVIIIGIGACSCNMKRNDSNIGEENEEKKKISELILNERQKEILKELRWSTNVEELDYFEKKAIIEIEEMLTAVEEKYNRSFSFIDYNGEGLGMGGLWENECLIAYPSDGARSIDSFEVRKVEGENGTEYEDDYMLVAIRDDYAKYVKELISSNLHTENIKVFADIYTTELTDIPDNKEDYEGNVSSWKAVFLYVSDSSEISKYLELIQQVLEEKGVRHECEVIFLKENILDEIRWYNYEDYLSSDFYIERSTIEVE